MKGTWNSLMNCIDQEKLFKKGTSMDICRIEHSSEINWMNHKCNFGKIEKMFLNFAKNIRTGFSIMTIAKKYF